MPKDKKEEITEPKKKMVVVEEVDSTPELVSSKDIEESKIEVSPKEEKQEVTSVSEPVVMEEVEKTNYLWIIIPTALLIGALVGGLITYFSGLSRLDDGMATPTPEATIVPSTTEATPSATPNTTISRGDIKVQILNGSGVSGLAGKAKAYLEGLGYKDVQTGNASKSDLTETSIAVKDSKKDSLSIVTADISKNYKVAKSTEVLPASSKYDFVITLGSQ